MTDPLTIEQARELAVRIINTMRPTPPIDDWTEELTGLSHRRAWNTFRKLRTQTEDGLRIATFMRHYRDDLAQERHEREPPRHCGLCDGTGWVEAPPHIAQRATVCRGTPGQHQGDNGCWCHAMTPCNCTAGRQAGRIVDRIETQETR